MGSVEIHGGSVARLARDNYVFSDSGGMTQRTRSAEKADLVIRSHGASERCGQQSLVGRAHVLTPSP
jgi:hypothetical protein